MVIHPTNPQILYAGLAERSSLGGVSELQGFIVRQIAATPGPEFRSTSLVFMPTFGTFAWLSRQRIRKGFMSTLAQYSLARLASSESGWRRDLAVAESFGR